jgi:hypothetical protein
MPINRAWCDHLRRTTLRFGATDLFAPNPKEPLNSAASAADRPSQEKTNGDSTR